LIELLDQTHRKFLINLKGSFMHGGWQLLSPTMLVELERSLLKWWGALYALASVWSRGEREKHTCALARLASPGRARCGVVR
jgi:hypothetical protein